MSVAARVLPPPRTAVVPCATLLARPWPVLRALCWPLVGLWVLLLAPAKPLWAEPAPRHLPQRNLLVEWRLSEQGHSQQRQVGVRTGQVMVDSRGQVIGHSSVGLSTVHTEGQSASVQQVQVLNGGQARLYVGRSQPYTTWQWVLTPGEASPQVVAQTVWLDLGQGLWVRPSWPGGQAPVQVVLQASQRRQAGALYGATEPDGQQRDTQVGSTLLVTLGQWATVVRSGSQASGQQAGALSTREVDEARHEQLDIRITAP